jgi:L-seryl-tRNA(Ser) seleniumtransferase
MAKLRKNPFARAMRVDKLTIGALEATLRLYLDPARARKEIPVLSMLTSPAEDLQRRGVSIAESLGARGIRSIVEATAASVGGGAFPTAQIPSFALRLEGSAGEIDRRLRKGALPVIGRVSEDRLLLDLRSVLPGEDTLLTEAVIRALA